jgi:uncharacterized UBP type Zn finger protein
VAADECTHVDMVKVIKLPAPPLGCEDCLKTGDQWVHLRMCLTCGGIRCCDESPNRHATAHWHQSDHPLIRSAEPEEDWAWCYVDELDLMFEPG